MTMGEKIRQARLEAGLSQRVLCGDVITRNMLSQIEHGTAKPSMNTLQYLAHQLGKPVSFFLDEEGAYSSNSACMARAWRKFEEGDFERALAGLREYQSPDYLYDREYSLLRNLVLLNMAEQNAASGKTVYARLLLEEAEKLESEHTWLPELKIRRILLLSRLGERIAPSDLPNADDLLMLHADAALESGNVSRAAEILDAVQNQQDARWFLRRGKTAMGMEDYAAAEAWLRQAEVTFPGAVIPLLESCYRELGDYQSAYRYACLRRDI